MENNIDIGSSVLLKDQVGSSDRVVITAAASGHRIATITVANLAKAIGDGGGGGGGADGKSAYDVAVENGFVGTPVEWLASLVGATGEDGFPGRDGRDGAQGAPGLEGRSAYDMAVENGFAGSPVQWLESLVGATGEPGKDGQDGAQGDAGPDGASAYEVARRNGFAGTEAEWLASLKGKDGANGKDGDDGADGAEGEDGLSAYEVAVENGFRGTEAEWLASLKGERGSGLDWSTMTDQEKAEIKGEKGDPGVSGVYYGDDEPGAEYDVWLDEGGEPDPGGGGGDYELTKEKIEAVLTGEIGSHHHAQQVAAAIQQAIGLVNSRIDTLVGGSAGTAIDTFREIEAFLQGITDVQTLTGILNDLKAQIVALIPQNAVQDAAYVHTDNNYTSTEKSKLAGIAAGANNYSLPAASATVLGGVRIGGGLKVSSGTVSLDKMAWEGTQAQYDALPAAQKTTDYICFITG